MHRAYVTILGLGLAIGLVVPADVEAAKPQISTDALPGVNFSDYRTFTWANAAPPAGVNPVMFQRIMGDIEQALVAKGYQKSVPGDLSLVLTIGAQDKTDVETWGRFGMQTSVYQYTVGQLSLDVFDTRTQKALWHGQASKTVNPDKPNPAAVDAAISKLMVQFPSNAPAPASPASEDPPKQ